MRIAYVCADFGIPVFGSKGAAIHVRELTRAFRALGNEVLIVAARCGTERPRDFDVEVVELTPDADERALVEAVRAAPAGGVALAGELRAALHADSSRQRLGSLLRDFGPDVVYERYSLLATAGGEVARELGVPHLLEVNAPLADEQARYRGLRLTGAVRATERAILGRATQVIVVSRALAAWAIGLGVTPGRVHVLGNAVDPDRLGGQEPAGKRLRAELGLEGRPVLGFVGTLKPWHDAVSLVRAVGALRRNGQDLVLLVVGDGPQRRELEELATAEGLARGAHFTGAVTHDRIPAHLAAMDVAAVPYAADDGLYFSPLKLFEYQAAALPVVAARAGEIEHCVRRGETGELYEPGDLAGLVNGLSRLLGDTKAARRLGEAGRRHVLAEHTWAGNARSVVGLVAAS